MFCGATKANSCKCCQSQTVSKNVRSQCNVWDFPAPGTPCKMARKGSDRVGLSALSSTASAWHLSTTAVKNLLLLLVGGRCQPGQVQSLQPRSGRVQPEGSVVHGHRAWRLRLLGEWICASCPGCGRWAGVWQTGRKLPRPLAVGAGLRGCPIVHKTLDSLGRPFRVLEPFSSSQALHGRHVNPACVDFPVRLRACLDVCFFDVVRRTLCSCQEIGNGAGGIGRHDVVANVVVPCTVVTAAPHRSFSDTPMGRLLLAIGYRHVQCLNVRHMQRGVVTRQSPWAEIDVQEAGLLVFIHIGFGQWA